MFIAAARRCRVVCRETDKRHCRARARYAAQDALPMNIDDMPPSMILFFALLSTLATLDAPRFFRLTSRHSYATADAAPPLLTLILRRFFFAASRRLLPPLMPYRRSH